MAPSRQVPDDQIIQLYEVGWRVSEIANIIDFCESAIYRALRRNQIELRPQSDDFYRVRKVTRLSDEEIELTRRLYESGLSLREVGSILGRGQQAIRHRLEIAGVSIRSRSEGLHLAYKSGRKVNCGKRHRPKHLHKRRGRNGQFVPA